MGNVCIKSGRSKEQKSKGDKPTCEVCGGDGKPHPKLVETVHWKQNVCRKHFKDGTPACSSCARFFKTVSFTENSSNKPEYRITENYIDLRHGQLLCLECHSTAIMDATHVEPIVNEVYDFYKEVGLQLINNLPVFVVDNDEMEGALQTRVNRFINNPDIPKIEAPAGAATIYHPQSKPSPQVIQSIVKCFVHEENITLVKESTTLPRRQTISILIKFGKPKVVASGILAHEMMHAWLMRQGCWKLEDQLKEGICEVMFHKFLVRALSVEKDEFMKKLINRVRIKIENNPSKTYGDGFRQVKAAVDQFGFHQTLNHMVTNKKLPQ